MQKIKKSVKTCVIMAVLALSFCQSTAFSQDVSDSYFFVEEGNFRNSNANINGTWGDMLVTDYNNGDILPIGDGLWILAAAAGIYLLARTRRLRGAATMILAVSALTLGTTQCRKPVQDDIVTPSGQTIFISINGGNGGGAKTDVDVCNGRITWNEGDKVYVVCNNALNTTGTKAVLFEGNLVVNDGGVQTSSISGSVTLPSSYNLPINPKLTFYYVGKGVSFFPDHGATTLMFIINNQTQSDIGVGGYMIGRTEPVEMKLDGTAYVPFDNPTAARTFTPLTAVLWLDTHLGFGSCTMDMDGDPKPKSKMTITLSNPESPTCEGGKITFNGGNNAQISVMPTDGDGDATFEFNGNKRTAKLTVKNGIKAGRVYAKLCDGEAHPMPVVGLPDGALPGSFTVDKSGKQVHFSQGNLQWSYTGGGPSQVRHEVVGGYKDGSWNFCSSQCYSSQNYDFNDYMSGKWLSLLGWGTSGNSVEPFMTSVYDSDYLSGSYDIAGTNDDWGVYNAITPGGNKPGFWYVLTKDEWEWLIGPGCDPGVSCRTASTIGGVANARFMKAKVVEDNNKCLIVFPDDFTWDSIRWGKLPSGVINSTTDNYTQYYIGDLYMEMEAAGAVFLPILSDRIGNGGHADSASYWSSSSTDTNSGWCLFVSDDEVKLSEGKRCYGRSVRLVCGVPTE